MKITKIQCLIFYQFIFPQALSMSTSMQHFQDMKAHKSKSCDELKCKRRCAHTIEGLDVSRLLVTWLYAVYIKLCQARGGELLKFYFLLKINRSKLFIITHHLVAFVRRRQWLPINDAFFDNMFKDLQHCQKNWQVIKVKFLSRVKCYLIELKLLTAFMQSGVKFVTVKH